LTLSSLCFSLCSTHRLYLHSFPTRRSSDLRAVARLLRADRRCGYGCPRNDDRAPCLSALAVELHLSVRAQRHLAGLAVARRKLRDRKSTRLNSSHQIISYAVFCLKKKKII